MRRRLRKLGGGQRRWASWPPPCSPKSAAPGRRQRGPTSRRTSRTDDVRRDDAARASSVRCAASSPVARRADAAPSGGPRTSNAPSPAPAWRKRAAARPSLCPRARAQKSLEQRGLPSTVHHDATADCDDVIRITVVGSPLRDESDDGRISSSRRSDGDHARTRLRRIDEEMHRKSRDATEIGLTFD